MLKKGFTLIEILLGLTMAVTIFIVATNLLVSLLFTTTKGRRVEELAQTRNDIETDIGTNARWAQNISYQNGIFKLDNNEYTIVDGRMYKNGSPLSSETVIVENLVISKQTVTSAITDPGAGLGLTGAYFNGLDFATLVETHTDFEVDFNWGRGSPSKQIATDRFSVRWTGQLEIPHNGRFTFYTLSDDGVRLWVNNVLLINDWTDHTLKTSQASETYEGGKLYDIRLEYYEKTADARISLSWSGPSISRQVIPTKYLHEVAAQSSLQITFDLIHRETPDMREAVSMFISPREGAIGSITPPTIPPTPTPPPTQQPSFPPTQTPVQTATATPTPRSSTSPTAKPTPKPTPIPTPTPKPLP